MKQYVLIATVLLLVGAGCNTAPKTEEMPADTMKMEDGAMHIGCQEGEVLEDGSCTPAEDTMMNALYKDVSDMVITTDVVTESHRGFVASPSTPGEYPGVVMIHEWWGLNDNIKQMAEQLAAEGYTVYAIDLYNGEVATESSDAGRLAGGVRSNPEAAVANMQAAAEYLRSEYGVAKLASLGWCFGGQQSLSLSLAEELDATVIYYGNLVTTTEALASVSGPVLGIFGSEDTSIPVDSVRAFESALDELTIENDIYVYDGVGHAFANPSGSRYAETEALDAWQKTLEFLAASL